MAATQCETADRGLCLQRAFRTLDVTFAPNVGGRHRWSAYQRQVRAV